MSDLIEKVAEAYLAAAGIDISNVTEKQRYREKELMGAAVKTVLEEMHKFSLSYDDKTENSEHFKGTREIHRETFLEKFARDNNITIGGG